jgi:hypothetical protein
MAASLRHYRYRRELHYVFTTLARRNGNAVQSGPFKGMIYVLPGLGVDQIYHYAAVPKLLGCYEAELHPFIEAEVARGYDSVMNVGCAEGFYVAGFARLFPRAQVFAFDIDPAALVLCRATAEANGVMSRVTLLGECAPSEFDRLASGRTLVVCDCEGAELEVLRPDLSPKLAVCDVLVELHPHTDPSIFREIPQRFASTHNTTLIKAAPRDPNDFPSLRHFNEYRRKLAVSEFREGIGQWAFFSAR